MQTTTIFNFSTDCNINQWTVTNDDVMGGVSQSRISINERGEGVFEGRVSTENNGGFVMTRIQTQVNCQNKEHLVLRIKDDGKSYQIRIKSNKNQRFWYVHAFKTSHRWQTIILALQDFYPSFRGRTLDMTNFSADTIEEIAILIGNKRTEDFKLYVDTIEIN